MPRPLHRTELVGAELVWLLTITYAGREFRWSSYPVSITDADGESLHFEGGLPALDVSEGLNLLSTTADPLSIPFEVFFPVDVAELVQRGHDLAAATAEVALHVPGNAWEDRRVVLVGSVVQPVYGGSEEPVSFSVEQNLYDDRALIPTASQRVTTTTWSGRPTASEGLYYPIVFGTPGAYTTAAGASNSTSGSPAIVVEMTGSNVDKLLIAGHRVSATTVRIWDGDGTGESFSVDHEEDGLGQVVAVVDITGAASVDRTTEDWWVAWNNGGAMLNDTLDGVREGAGEIIEWMLRQSTNAVDRGRWQAKQEAFNRLAPRLAPYIDEPVSPWEWVADNVLPLLPLSIVAGPDGLYPVLWRFDATAADAVEHIKAGPGVVRVGRVIYTRRPREVTNEIRLDYAKKARDGAIRRSITIRAEPSDAAEEVSSYYAEVSQARYGVGAKAIDSDIVYDDTTAGLIVRWMLRAEGFSLREVVYEVGPEFGWLPRGEVVTLEDDELHWSEQVALVKDVRQLEVGVALELLVLEDIVRDEVAL